MRFNKPLKFKNENKITILYASSVKDGTKRYLYETADELLESFQDIIEIISTCNNINLIIKFRDTESFTHKSLNVLLDKLPNNVSIETKGNFGYLLASSHLLISFSSTTIEEALINDVPVLLYGGKGRYSHIPTKPFELGINHSILNPVTFVNSKKSLNEYIKKLDNTYNKYIKHNFNFDNYRLNDTISVIDWIDKYGNINHV